MRRGLFCRIIIIIFFTCINYICCGNSLSYYQNIWDLSRKEYEVGNHEKALEYLSEIYTYAKNNDRIDLQMKTLNNMGIVYNDIFDYSKAIDCFLEGYATAIKTNNSQLEMAFLINIGTIYDAEGKILKAKEYTEKAYELALREKDSTVIGLSIVNLGSFANKMGNLDLAKKYLDMGLPIVVVHVWDTNSIIYAKITKAENLYLRGDYDEAEQFILKTMDEIPEKHKNRKVECLLLLSKIYQKRTRFSEAIQFALQASAKNSDIERSIEIYEQLADLYLDIKVPLLAVQYKDSIIAAKDSLTELYNQVQFFNSQIRFELLNSEKELVESKARQKSERILLISLLIFITILAAVLIWIFRIRSVKNKQQKIITELRLKEEENNKILLEQQLKEQEALALLKQERLANEIENKNKQLTARILFQSNRNKLIKELIFAFSDAPHQKGSPILGSIIQKLNTQLKDSADANNFLTQLEQVNPSFILQLKEKHPDLLFDEIRFLSYIYLYPDIKKIAHLLNVSLDACRKRKERIALKLGVKTMDLHNYLLEIMRSSISEDLSDIS